MMCYSALFLAHLVVRFNQDLLYTTENKQSPFFSLILFVISNFFLNSSLINVIAMCYDINGHILVHHFLPHHSFLPVISLLNLPSFPS